MNSAFTVLTFANPEDPDLAYIEHVAGSIQLEKPDQVRACRHAFERLQAEARTPLESLELIAKLVADEF